LVRHDHAARNPVGEVERPAINRDEGSMLAFSKTQARKMLDAPSEVTVAGLRDRAILSVGLQVGLRRADIAALNVGDLHQEPRRYSLRVARKGGRRDAPRTCRRPPHTVTQAPPSCMIGVATTPRKRQASLQPADYPAL
jgi:integrase/recombinase XerD